MAVVTQAYNGTSSASYDLLSGLLTITKTFDVAATEPWDAVGLDDMATGLEAEGVTGDGIPVTSDGQPYIRHPINFGVTTATPGWSSAYEVSRTADRIRDTLDSRVTVIYESHMFGVVDWSIDSVSQRVQINEALEDATVYDGAPGADGPKRRIGAEGKGTTRLEPMQVMRVVQNYPTPEAITKYGDAPVVFVWAVIRPLIGSVNEADWAPQFLVPFDTSYDEGTWLYTGAEIVRNRDTTFTFIHSFMSTVSTTPPTVLTHQHGWYNYAYKGIDTGAGQRKSRTRDGTINLSKIYPIAGTTDVTQTTTPPGTTTNLTFGHLML